MLIFYIFIAKYKNHYSLLNQSNNNNVIINFCLIQQTLCNIKTNDHNVKVSVVFAYYNAQLDGVNEKKLVIDA